MRARSHGSTAFLLCSSTEDCAANCRAKRRWAGLVTLARKSPVALCSNSPKLNMVRRIRWTLSSMVEALICSRWGRGGRGEPLR